MLHIIAKKIIIKQVMATEQRDHLKKVLVNGKRKKTSFETSG